MGQLLGSQQQQLTAVNISAAITHIAQLHPGEAPSSPQLQGLILRLLEAVSGSWASLAARQLANITWALGKLGMQPPAKWLRTLCVRLEAFSAQLEPQHISSSLLGLASMSGMVPEQTVQRLLAAAVHRLPAFKPQEVSTVLYALAKLGYMPGPDAMSALLAAVYSKIAAFKARELASVLWSLGKLQYKPSPHWINCLLVAVEIKLKVGGLKCWLAV